MLREVAWKLADRALVMADWDGFREECLLGDRPAGLLRWVSRMLTSTGLLDAWWWAPYSAVGVALGIAVFFVLPHRRLRWLPLWMVGAVALAFFPLWTFNTSVWTDPEPASAIMNSLGLLIVFSIALLWRHVPRRTAPLLTGALVCCALYPFLGVYPLLGGIFFVVSLARCRRWLPTAAALVSLALTLPLAAVFLYGGMAMYIALDHSHAFRRRFMPSQPLAPILAMERRVREGDWNGVIAIADERQRQGADFPLRMEIAYRILAQFHTARLPDDLFKYPIRTSHVSCDAEQLFMDGHLLLFGYGLLLPARREIFERIAMSGLDPGHLRLLGDIALLRRERSLAFRYYAMLARCPFRERFTDGRLKFMHGEKGSDASDLAPIAAMMSFVDRHSSNANLQYYNGGQNVELYVYSLARTIPQGPNEIVRLLLSVGLLSGDDAIIGNNLAALSALYSSPAAWPDVMREALLEHAFRLEDGARNSFLAGLPAGAITQAATERFAHFATIANSSTPDQLIPEFGRTYHFYRNVVVGGGQ